MHLFHRFPAFASVLLLAALLLTAGCGMSEEEARQKLADLNVEYTQDTFVEHAAEGDGTVVDLFLKAGMNPAASAGQEALVGAVEGGHAEVARRIMEAGATLDAGSEQAATVLVEAAKSGNAELVQMLLEAEGDPNARADVRVPFENVFPPSIIERIGQDRMEDRFGEEGVPVEGATPLIGAVAGGNPAVVRALLEAGADPNAEPEGEGRGGPPVALAVMNNRSEIVRALLEAGADPNAKPDEGSLLSMAATLGHAETVRALLEAGADPDFQESDDELAALMMVAGAASDRGAPDVSTEDRQEITRALLEAGADPNLEDEDGETALQHAVRNDYDEVAQMLREAGAQEPAQSSRSDVPGADTIAITDTAMVPSDNLDRLKRELTSARIDGRAVSNVFTQLGRQTQQAAQRTSRRQMTRLQVLARALSQAGNQLRQYRR